MKTTEINIRDPYILYMEVNIIYMEQEVRPVGDRQMGLIVT